MQTVQSCLDFQHKCFYLQLDVYFSHNLYIGHVCLAGHMLHDKPSNTTTTGQTVSACFQVTTADVVPPNFTASTPLVTSVHETDFTLLVQLNKSSCTVYFSVMLATAPQPSIDSVQAGTAPGNLFMGHFWRLR